MSFEPATGEMTQVHFTDEDHAYEGPEMGNDSDALIEQLESMDNYHLNSRKKSNIMCRAICVLIPVFVAVGACFYFLFQPGQSSARSSSHALVAPPANLEARCATSGEECRQACEPAECCDFPVNLQLSCLQGNEDFCLKYHAFCGILTGKGAPVTPENAIPPPPKNLKNVCSASSIATVDGFMECQEACQPADCCFRDDQACHDDSCNAYATCLALTASTKMHVDIPPNVAEACSDLDTVPGRTDCRVACSQSLCCFLDGSSSSCPHPDNSFCSQYAICNQLEADVNVKSSPDEIEQLCSSEHKSLCEVVCERGACCFASERCPTDEIKCDDYLESCSVLYGDTRDDDNNGGGEDGTESGDDITDSGESQGGDDTSGSDQSAGGTGGDSSTEDGTGDNNTVIEREDDGTADDDGTGSIVFKADVDDACIDYDPGSASAAQSLCPKLCEDVGCCFTGNGCGSAPINCRTYEECDIIYGVEDGDDDEEGGGNTVAGDDATSGESNTAESGGSSGGDASGTGGINAITDACDSHKEDAVSVPDQPTQCQVMCQRYTCCFEVNDCPVAKDVDCSRGSGCSTLWGGTSTGGSGEDTTVTTGGDGSTNAGASDSTGNTGDGSTVDSIVDACDSHTTDRVQVPDQPTQCETMCEKYKCCYDVNDCPVAKGLNCSKGDGCNTLWGGVTGEADSTGEGNNSGERDAVVGTTGGPSTGSTGSTETTGSSDGDSAVIEACANYEESSMTSLCDQLCEKYKCCFGVNYCDIPAGTECSLGSACSAIWKTENGGGNGDPADDPPEDVLTEDFGPDDGVGEGLDGEGEPNEPGDIPVPIDASLYETLLAACEESSDMANCESLCMKGKCCFDGQACNVPEDVNCDDYEGCLVVYAVDGEDQSGGDDNSVSEGADPNAYTKADIDAACSGGAVSSMCSVLCDPSECCYRTGMMCSANTDCSKYDSCSQIWGRRLRRTSLAL